MSVTLSGVRIPQELLGLILQSCPPEQNATNMRVCKAWQAIAGTVMDEQSKLLLENAMTTIERNAEAFLEMDYVKNLKSYCPAYAQLAQARDNPENLALEQVRALINNAIETQHVCIAKVFRIGPNDTEIPSDLTKHYADRVFVELHTIDPVGLWEASSLARSVKYLPIELFKKGDGCVQKKIYFFLYGRLIKLIIEEGSAENYQSYWCNYPRTNRETAIEVKLDPPGIDGFLWPEEFYIAECDALHRPNESSVFGD